MFSLFARDRVQGNKFDNPIQATGKRVIITGTTSGIGMATAKELSKRGAHVYMACRDMQRCEELCEQFILETKNKHVHCMECDLGSMESIRNFVEACVQLLFKMLAHSISQPLQKIPYLQVSQQRKSIRCFD